MRIYQGMHGYKQVEVEYHMLPKICIEYVSLNNDGILQMIFKLCILKVPAFKAFPELLKTAMRILNTKISFSLAFVLRQIDLCG